MSVVDVLMKSLGGDAMGQIGRKLGKNDDEARGVTSAAITALLGGLAKNADRAEGAEALLGALNRDHDGAALNRVNEVLGGAESAQGAGILKHVFGGKQAGVEKAIGKSFGVDDKGVGNVMAMLAPLVMGAIGKQARQGGMDASSLTRMLGQERKTLAKAEPQGMQMFGAILDADGDGDVDMGDIMRKGAGLFGKLMG